MTCVEEIIDHKTGRKHKTWTTKFLYFFVICDLREQKTIKGQIFINIKFKNIYTKIDDQFPKKITLISNDADL